MKPAMECRRWTSWICLGWLTGLVGCLPTQETRFLSCLPRSPGVEARSYDIHDPFPDEDIGPNTFSRPRAFQRPRSETRKSNDLRFIQAAKDSLGPSQVVWDPSGSQLPPGAPVQPIWRTPPPAAPPPIAISAPRMWDGGTSQYNVVGP